MDVYTAQLNKRQRDRKESQVTVYLLMASYLRSVAFNINKTLLIIIYQDGFFLNFLEILQV